MSEFIWSAKFSNNSEINQFNEDGSENSFKTVMDKSNFISFFSLTNGVGNVYKVNLNSGSFVIDGVEIFFVDEAPELNFRLIFFKRRRSNFGIGGFSEATDETEYWLGFQAKINGENVKKMMQISNGKVFLRDES